MDYSAFDASQGAKYERTTPSPAEEETAGNTFNFVSDTPKYAAQGSGGAHDPSQEKTASKKNSADASSSDDENGSGDQQGESRGSGKIRPRLNYHRNTIACSYCRHRKIRCVISGTDGRCENCVRTNKECKFLPVGGGHKRSSGSKSMSPDLGGSTMRFQHRHDSFSRTDPYAAAQPQYPPEGQDEVFQILRGSYNEPLQHNFAASSSRFPGQVGGVPNPQSNFDTTTQQQYASRRQSASSRPMQPVPQRPHEQPQLQQSQQRTNPGQYPTQIQPFNPSFPMLLSSIYQDPAVNFHRMQMPLPRDDHTQISQHDPTQQYHHQERASSLGHLSQPPYRPLQAAPAPLWPDAGISPAGGFTYPFPQQPHLQAPVYPQHPPPLPQQRQVQRPPSQFPGQKEAEEPRGRHTDEA